MFFSCLDSFDTYQTYFYDIQICYCFLLLHSGIHRVAVFYANDRIPDGALASSRVLQSLRLLEKDLDVIASNPEADRIMEENIRKMEEEKRIQVKVE